MDTYRAFILDDQDRIVRAEVLTATNDEAAIAAAGTLSAESEVEIWRGSTRIARMLKGGGTVQPGIDPS